MSTKKVRSKENLVQALNDQLSAISSSGNAYDRGDLWEAKRIAAAVHMIVHDGKMNNRSIASQLGIRGTMAFLSSTDVPHLPDKNLILGPELFPQPRLLRFQMESNKVLRVIARLDGCIPRTVGIAEWWNEPIYEHGAISISRSSLIRTMRDQDGGGHVDPELERAYSDFTDSIGNGVTATADGRLVFTIPQIPLAPPPNQEGLPIPHGPLASARQIGWEILKAFEHPNVWTDLHQFGFKMPLNSI